MPKSKVAEALKKENEELKAKLALLEQVPAPIENTTVVNEPPKAPIPQDYRNAVNEVLNKDFGVEIEYLTDRPAFQFGIIVPEKYSNVPKNKRVELNGRDFRSKIIDNNQGATAVKEYAELVHSNFDQATQTIIKMDR